MAKLVITSREYLTEIAAEYKHAMDLTDTALKQSLALSKTLQANYDGQAEMLARNAFEKLDEHLELVKSGLTALKSYVEMCRDDMDETDYELGVQNR